MNAYTRPPTLSNLRLSHLCYRATANEFLVVCEHLGAFALVMLLTDWNGFKAFERRSPLIDHSTSKPGAAQNEPVYISARVSSPHARYVDFIHRQHFEILY
jgi:hypothetical protein